MLQLFNYNENPVSFRKENDTVYVNATEMAKPFGKKPNDYLRLAGTEELIQACARKNRTSVNQLVITQMGSTENGGGTWLNEDLAIDFAQWLSVDFRLWVADRIKEVLQYGFTATPQMLENLIQNPQLVINLATALQDERTKNEIAQHQLETANNTIKSQAPKVEYYNEVLQSKSDITTTVIAGQLGMSAKALNKLLHQHKIQYKVDGVWKLYSKYEGQGYTESRTHVRTDEYGNTRTDILTTWSEKGRLFIHQFVKSLKQPA